jgi:CRP-like cAMP-binding protein
MPRQFAYSFDNPVCGVRSMVETPIDFSILTGQGAPVLEFKAGEVIFDKEDSADVMYIIKSGKVEIRLGNRLLESVSPNNIFGEMALVDHGCADCSCW